MLLYPALVTKKERNGEWEILLPKSVPGFTMYLKAKEGIQVWMVKLATDTVEKANIEYIQEVFNSRGEIICQRRMRVVILVTKTAGY